ncbi:peptidase C14, partial [Methylococcaceae bacterium CS3]
MESAQNPVNFILLDACRDNPFRGFRGGQKGLAESRAPEGSLISFATGPGKVAADGISQHNSPYTKALLSALTQPGLEVLRNKHETTS